MRSGVLWPSFALPCNKLKRIFWNFIFFHIFDQGCQGNYKYNTSTGNDRSDKPITSVYNFENKFFPTFSRSSKRQNWALDVFFELACHWMLYNLYAKSIFVISNYIKSLIIGGLWGVLLTNREFFITRGMKSAQKNVQWIRIRRVKLEFKENIPCIF